MTTEELATKIYRHVLSLSTSGEHWDKWDDKREIENIKRLIDNHRPNQPGDLPTAELDII